MAKTTAPLLSFDARGSIGQSLVFSSWKGQKYARRYTVPSNPRTVEQLKTRKAFTWVHEAFKYLPAAVMAVWNAYAVGKPLTGPNAFSQANISELRGSADITGVLFAKPVNGGPGGVAPTIVAGANQLTVTTPAPALPPGWSIVANHVIAMAQQEPIDEALARSNHYGTDNTDPYSVVLAGLVTGTDYVVGSFFELMDPKGKLAYTGSQNTVGTPT